ncbi:glycosyltransferase [Conexibacter sp. DBS9H8]|uniref:glycosyltransferase n=1 Tax=Conexibacter sp. DBS9H8 TaxID=2937801 RepID=UPI00200D9220|nr:glycosyltransferase [Conexibacter sp. DBS9H8]
MTEATRTHAALANLEELAEAPELLAAWSACVGPHDPVTLVVVPGGWDPERVQAEAPALFARAGLDQGEASPDIVVMTGPLDEVDFIRLSGSCTAIFGAAPVPAELAELPRIGADELPEWTAARTAPDADDATVCAQDVRVISERPGVNVIGYVSGSLGLGIAARATIAALLAADVDVAVVDVSLGARSNADTSYHHLRVDNLQSLPHAVNLIHYNPDDASVLWERFPAWFAGGVNCIVPFWELVDLPPGWLAPLARYDVVLAPTAHIAAAVSRAVSVPVRRFPMAADVGHVPAIDRSEFGIPEGKVAFATSWDTNSGLERKNGTGVVRAFAAALDFGADAVLVIKLNGDVTDPLFLRELSRLPADRVVVISDYLPYSRVLGLYAACDAYISLHRAEGLGLGIQEAMQLGKPVIATGWSGNMDFMDEECAAVVDFRLTPVVDGHPCYSPPQYPGGGLWAEPDLLVAARHIHRLAGDAAARTRLGAAARGRGRAYREQWLRTAPRQLAAVSGALRRR